MVYNRPTTEFNQFCAANNDAYNHTSYLQKHWDGNGITDQIMYSLGFFPTWKKKNPKRAPGIPLGIRVSFGGDTFVKNTVMWFVCQPVKIDPSYSMQGTDSTHSTSPTLPVRDLT